jgi:hypothetical protein
MHTSIKKYTQQDLIRCSAGRSSKVNKLQESSRRPCHLAKRVIQRLSLGLLSVLFPIWAPSGFAAGMESLAKPAEAPVVKPNTSHAPAAASAPGAVPAPSAPAPAAVPAVGKGTTEEAEDEDGKEPKADGKAAAPAVVKSSASILLENRLSLGTSVGWAVVKPAKGTWVGTGASDLSVQWRISREATGNTFITGRYAPFAGVWTVNRRDYDTTLHGLYLGGEARLPTTKFGNVTYKAGVELGYMLVYAKAQDKVKASSGVAGGKVNFTAGGGADWGVCSNKVLVGPFARVHVAGFSIFNIGGSARFVF